MIVKTNKFFLVLIFGLFVVGLATASAGIFDFFKKKETTESDKFCHAIYLHRKRAVDAYIRKDNVDQRDGVAVRKAVDELERLRKNYLSDLDKILNASSGGLSVNNWELVLEQISSDGGSAKYKFLNCNEIKIGTNWGANESGDKDRKIIQNLARKGAHSLSVREKLLKYKIGSKIVVSGSFVRRSDGKIFGTPTYRDIANDISFKWRISDREFPMILFFVTTEVHQCVSGCQFR